MFNKINEILIKYNITHITDTSKEANKNSVFLCLPKAIEKGYDKDAIQNGCKILIEILSFKTDAIGTVFNIEEKDNIYKIYIPSWKFFVTFLQKFYNTDIIKKVAITGTNGKSSTVHFCASLYSMTGHKAATIGTNGICYYEDGQITKSNYVGLTTLTCVKNHQVISQMQIDGIECVFMEASSIGIHQGRIDGLYFDICAFTNLTQDHLDYHHTMEEYFNQKAHLFSQHLKPNGVSVLNSNYESLFKSMIFKGNKIYYGKELFESTNFGHLVNVKEKQIPFYAFGSFQVQNLFCAMKVIQSLGFTEEEITQYISKLTPPEGRMHSFKVGEVNVIVDFAHTPDALEKVLKSISCYKVCVFGCGGDRDKTKRKLMGKIASENAECVIITNDNPRTEDPYSIAKEIVAGCTKNCEIMLDRKLAIQHAIQICHNDGMVIVAGRGNETHQIIGHQKIEFSDIDFIKSLI